MSNTALTDSNRPSIGGKSFLLNRQSYSFPLLKSSEIIFCLNELGIKITEDELANPEKFKERIKIIFESLIEICTGITREEINQPAFSGLTVLNFPELHEDSIPELNLFRACQKMMDTCGIQDFTIKDFVVPNQKRLRRQLSGIINFAKFRQERFALLTELNIQRDLLIEEMNRQRSKNDELNNRLTILRNQTSEESEIISAVEGECREVEARISSLNYKQAEIREHSSELKTSSNRLKDEIASASLRLEEMEARRRKLQSQIVASPEKFRKRIADVAQTLQQEQSEVKGFEKKCRELAAWHTAADEAHTLVSSAIEALVSIGGEVERKKAVAQELEAQRSYILGRRQALLELEQNTLRVEHQTNRAEEKLRHLRKGASGRGAEVQTATDSVKQQLLEAEQHRSKAKSRAERSEMDALRLGRDFATLKTQQEAELAEMCQSYQHMERLVVSHLRELRRACEESLPPHCA